MLLAVNPPNAEYGKIRAKYKYGTNNGGMTLEQEAQQSPYNLTPADLTADSRIEPLTSIKRRSQVKRAAALLKRSNRPHYPQLHNLEL
jgi:hypothetical protein